MTVRRPEFVGPYAIEDELGMGGMGEVLRGRHALLDREVAIKLRARGRTREEPVLAERFRHTACLQGELDHPAIARIYDYLELPDHQALVLEFLAGGSVADRLTTGAIDVATTLAIGIRAAEALDYAHARGVVHRDIKPDNLMLMDWARPETARLTDFGVAKSTDRSPNLTMAGANVGTVWYMSPEQFNHEDPTPGFDIYSLGATLYEMLTGHIPFASTDQAEIFRRFLDGVPVPPIRDRAAHVSPALAAVIEAALALDAAERVPSAAALALLLRGVAETGGVSLDDGAARRLFSVADGAELRRLIRRLELTSSGNAAARQFLALDARLHQATAVTRLDLETATATPAEIDASLNTMSMNHSSLLAAMLDEEELPDDDEDHTLVMMTPLDSD